MSLFRRKPSPATPGTSAPASSSASSSFSPPADLLDKLRSLRGTGEVLVLTGAGVSAESGIATFRDALTGLWSRFDPAKLGTVAGFLADPPLVWGWYAARREQAARARPNAGHHALAALEGLFPRVMLATQNVDDLHERAGSRDVIHLHGRLDTAHCLNCREPHPLPTPPTPEPAGGRRLAPPHCMRCGGYVRPGVVWFGEELSEDDLGRVQAAAQRADAVLVVGTSGMVYPVAGVPALAREAGALVIQINPEPSALDAVCDHNLRGTAVQVLPPLVAALQAGSAGPASAV